MATLVKVNETIEYARRVKVNEAIEYAMQMMRNAIRSNQREFIVLDLYFSWVEEGLKRTKVNDDHEIRKRVYKMRDKIQEIRYGANLRKDVLPTKFLELEKILIKKIGIKPSK